MVEALEEWSGGVLEFWTCLPWRDVGTLEFWNDGVLELWNFGVHA